MSTIKILQDVSLYSSITAVDITADNITILNSADIPEVNALINSALVWDDVAATVQSNSGDWGGYATLNTLSSVWNDTTVIVASNSGSWNDVVANVQAGSGDWGGYATLNALSSTWSDASVVLESNSGAWIDTYTLVSSDSADWVDTYVTVSSSSANWNDVTTNVATNSGTWTDTYNTVYTNSSSWSEAYSNLNSNSGNWDSVYNTVQSTSANPTLETLRVTVSSTLGDTVGIGTSTPDESKALHIVGDVLVYGNLSANGAMTFTNTLFTTTSALSVVNNGTGPALVVAQEGDQPIAAFYDHTASGISLWIDGAADRPGFVGVKTESPNKELTVVGDVSATGRVYSANSFNRFVSAFGDGSSTSFVIDHNLGTEYVVCNIFNTSTKEVVYPTVTLTSNNSITIDFNTAPTVSAYTITVIG